MTYFATGMMPGFLKVLLMIVALVAAVLLTAWIGSIIAAHAVAILAGIKATGVVIAAMTVAIKLPLLLL